jgi:hypothetical protein
MKSTKGTTLARDAQGHARSVVAGATVRAERRRVMKKAMYEVGFGVKGCDNYDVEIICVQHGPQMVSAALKLAQKKSDARKPTVKSWPVSVKLIATES